MSLDRQLSYQKQENEEIVTALLEDGSDPDALYNIEHHFSSVDFDTLEKAAVELFKKGYELGEPEELELDDGARIFCCDVIIEQELSIERLDEDCEKLMRLAEDLDVQYDGWGTHYISLEDDA